MSPRTGSADLPLHTGRVPQWLADRMSRMGRLVAEIIIHHYGRREFLARLAHPFWFQSFGAVMGMDWHSSGITTSVLGALKKGLTPLEGELGLKICGGRGKHSRKTPAELTAFGEKTGIAGDELARASRLVAKVDGTALQDGYQLYLHTFIVTDEGEWTVVQQGMNPELRLARRYHWFSPATTDFVNEPHAAIEGERGGTILNLTDRRAALARRLQVELLEDPQKVILQLKMPSHHQVRASNLNLRRLYSALSAASARGPVDFPDLLMTPGVGPRTVESLALVAEIIHGAPCRFKDPARFSYAHGGKDGSPFPVPLKVYDQTLRVLRQGVEHARLGNADRLSALERIDQESRRLEAVVEEGLPFHQLIRRERSRSRSLGGRTVFSGPSKEERSPQQGRLFPI